MKNKVNKEDLANMQIADVVVVCDWELIGFNKFHILIDILCIVVGSIGFFLNLGILVLLLILGFVSLIEDIISYRKSKKK